MQPGAGDHFGNTKTQAVLDQIVALGDFKNTIRSVDATANSFLRDAVTNFTTGVTRPEQIVQNVASAGWQPTPEQLSAIGEIARG